MPQPWRLIDRDSGDVVIESLALADGYWSRLLGLQFRAGLPAGSGLLLAPCSSVHTCCMRFALDIALLDRRGQVLSVRRHVPPWRLVFAPRSTHAVLETSAGGCLWLAEGQSLAVPGSAGESLPKALEFLRP